MHKRIFSKVFIIILSYTLSSCYICNFPLYEYPPDWKGISKRDSVLAYYSKYLNGKKIFLDPGHGGEDRKNRSKDGKIIEADVNLRVALYLREYLQKAGAVVIMSREEDKTVPLYLRSELANQSNADLFISIHHNAPAKWEDDYTNYTATYYHAKEDSYEYEPCERDIAKYIQRDLSYVMGNPGGLGSFDGTYSDYEIYPGEGFSVLRKTKIPAVLVECAFHTSRLENLRLNDEVFNQIQAWGIFRGIGKYYRAGIPEIVIIKDSVFYKNNLLKIAFMLKDSSGINPKSIRVYFNKEEVSFQFVNNIVSLGITVNDNKENFLRVICANKNGNHSLPFHKKILINKNDEVKILDIN
ncbi:MAG: N-acetylmuramoyl-L-alanine amidase [Melioribacter sp.]|nr:N-acetylmuramoyl-L-alanine amidase [Melioribacter sp.]